MCLFVAILSPLGDFDASLEANPAGLNSREPAGGLASQDCEDKPNIRSLRIQASYPTLYLSRGEQVATSIHAA